MTRLGSCHSFVGGIMFDFFTEFPDMSRRDLRDFKLAVDGAFRDFSRANGEAIEGFFRSPAVVFDLA